ncbi:apolipoprotein N-acyltransferase [Candidatus Methylacidithermus pantelleriae]|uniref:Apolipoprotein N-acyltransferase n=1 Tax=Candidatus Methylacidithermus pantelleriae TaxID=2744239 RepID=A0A8J2BT15_9BACT|nr:apolipoprotein N-acyltransferase [Candidatus Methylacidithermus pantelleriae]CAF0698174.1 Apolipoprotein N-acyltransferase [Candidatus Methylacidithermus pantelleriae]
MQVTKFLPKDLLARIQNRKNPALVILWSASFLSGFLLVLSFPPFSFTWLSWVCLIPYLVAVSLFAGKARACWASGYGLGLIFFGGTLWWIGHVTVAGTLALVLYLSLYPAFFGWAAVRSLGRSLQEPDLGSLWMTAGELASLWVVLEWIRGWMLTGFPWNWLGSALYPFLHLRQGASLGGVLLLSWLLVFTNALAAVVLSSRWRKGVSLPHSILWVKLGGLLCLWGSLWLYGAWWKDALPKGPEKTITLLAIQPNIPQVVDRPFPEDQAFAKMLAVTQKALSAHPKPDLLIWPETPIGNPLVQANGLWSGVQRVWESNQGFFLLGSVEVDGGKVYNSAFLLAPPSQPTFWRYRKNHLVMFGEYIPLGNVFPFLRQLVPYTIDFTPGQTPSIFPLSPYQVRLAPLICFEDTLPSYVRSVALLGPDFFVNLTNDGWFHQSPGAWQHLANAIFRAVECDRVLFQCANTGITAWVNQDGTIREMLRDSQGKSLAIEGFLAARVSWHTPRKTLYLHLGDWIVVLSAAWILSSAGLRAHREGSVR